MSSHRSKFTLLSTLFLLFALALSTGMVAAQSSTAFVDAYGDVTSAVPVGGTVYLRVTSPTADDPGLIDSITVDITTSSGDYEGATLTETGYSTGIFEGTLSSDSGAVTSSDGSISGPFGTTVDAIHYEPGGGNSTAQATLRASVTYFVDAAGQPTDVVLEGAQARLRVEDHGVGSPSFADSISLDVTVNLTADFETVYLYETGDDTGIYEGGIDLETSSAFVGDNRVQTTVLAGPPPVVDTLTAMYYDNGSGSSDSAQTVGSRSVFIDAYGNEVSTYAAEGTVYVRVEDQNANTLGQWDTTSVTLRSLTTGDSESLTLDETTRDSGIFEGSIELQSGAPSSGDDILQASIGEDIEAEHVDALGYTSSLDTASIAEVTVEFLDESGAPTGTLLEGSVSRVRLRYAEGNQNGGSIESHNVLLSSLYVGDQETVSVTETAPDSGVFEGSFQLVVSPSVQQDGALQTGGSGAPEYLYDQVNAQFDSGLGIFSADATMVGARVEFVDAFGRVSSVFAAGDDVRFRVTDYVRGSAQQIDTLLLDVAVPSTGDYEGVTLTETGYDTGVYVGSIASEEASGLSTTSDGALQADLGNDVVAQYYPSTVPATLTATARMAGAGIWFVDQQGQLATSYLENSRVFIRVFHASSNNPSIVDSLSVDVYSFLAGDFESVFLSETGQDTGIFEGSIDLRTESFGNSGDGFLQTTQSLGPPHEFETLEASFYDGISVATTSATTRGSTTELTDMYGGVPGAAGNGMKTYASGETVYVRVEDQNANTLGQWDTTSVTVRSLTTGDSETLTLAETTRDSGIFVGSVAMQHNAFAGGGDGLLQAVEGEDVEAEHVDALGYTSSKDSAMVRGAGVRFLDANGMPTQTLLESSVARVRVTSMAADADSLTADTVSVTVAALYSGDSESVTLTETGVSTGIFEGDFQLTVTPSTLGDGQLRTDSSGPPEYNYDQVTASYLDVGGTETATATMVGASVAFVDANGQPVDTFAVGHLLYIQAIDFARNNDQMIDTMLVDLSVPETGDYEGVTLTETGYDTGIFVGQIATSEASGFASTSDGTIQAAIGNTVRLDYYPSTVPATLSTETTAVGSSVLFIRELGGEPASVFLEGSRATIRAFHAASNNPGSLDTISVDVYSFLAGDFESVILSETGQDTGIFEGSIDLRTESFGNSGDGWLQTTQSAGPPHEFETLEVSFYDGTNVARATASTLGSRTFFLDASGNVPGGGAANDGTATYAVGETVYLRVEDQNANTLGQWDTTSVTVRSLTTGDSETLTLLETTRESGLFEGSLPMVHNPISNFGDNQLQAIEDESLEAEHVDALGYTSSKAAAEVADARLLFLDANGAPTSTVLESSQARVQLLYLLGNTDIFNAESFNVDASSFYQGDAETVMVTETGPDTGVFEGTLQLTVQPSTPSDGQLETGSSGPPEYLYDRVDLNFLTGAAVTVTASATTVGASIEFIDAFGRPAASFAIGDQVRMRVTDYSRGDSQMIDTMFVDLMVPATGDYEGVTLTETGYDTGVFVGAIGSQEASGFSSTSDGTLQADIGDSVRLDYYPATVPSTLSASAAFTGSSLLFIDGFGGAPADVFLEGSTAYLRVFHAASNDPFNINQISVDVYAFLAGDFESVQLTETGQDTGTFEGSIDLRTDSASVGDGFLQTTQSPGPPHEFETLEASFYDGTDVARDTASTVGSRTLFLDAYGNLVGAGSGGGGYAVAETVYVRVEDQNANTQGLFDTTSVTVRSLTTGDSETLTLTETTEVSGIFEGSISMQEVPSATAGDGLLQAVAGETLDAEHVDALGFTASSDQAPVRASTVRFLDGPGGMPVTVLLESSVAWLRVSAAGANSDGFNPEQVTVSLDSQYAGDSEVVTLDETGDDTGVFEGSFQLTVNPSTQGDGLLRTLGSDPPEYLYDSVAATYSAGPGDTMVTIATMVGARLAFLDAFGNETDSGAAGDQVRLRLVDYSRGSNQIVDDIFVDLMVPATGDYEGVTLTETGFDTGVYEGSIASAEASGFSTTGDGTLQGDIGDTVRFVYYPSTVPATLSAELTLTGSSIAFVDAEGKAAQVYLEDSTAYVRLFHAASNDPFNTDFVSVDLYTKHGGDFESLSLTETGFDTAVFEGPIELRSISGAASIGDGFLETSQVPGGVEVFDTLTVNFYDGSNVSTDSARLTGSTTTFTDAFGNSVDTYPASDRVYIEVVNQSSNTPGLYDSISVTLRGLTYGDSESVTLSETEPESGLFRGSMQMAQDVVSPGDGTLQALVSEILEVEFVDPQGNSASKDTAEVVNSSLNFIDGPGGVPVDTVLEGGVAWIRAFKASSNVYPETADFVYVDVTSQFGGDIETVVLTETGNNTGAFEGSVQLTYGAGVFQGDGVLETGTGGPPTYSYDTLDASFDDASDSATTIGARLEFVDAFGNATGTVTIDDQFRLRVVDYVRGTPASVDTFFLDLNVPASGDIEGMTLTETGPDTGIYEGSITSERAAGYSTQGNGTVEISYNEVVVATYYPSTAPATLTAQATALGASLHFLDQPGGTPVSSYLQGTTLTLRVFYAQSNINPTQADQVSVDVSSNLTGDFEYVTLTETGPDTSIFEGSLPMQLASSGTSSDGFLQTWQLAGPPVIGDTITALFWGCFATPITAQATTTGSATTWIDSFGNAVDTYPTGGTVYVRVEDHAADSSPAANTTGVQLTSASAGDVETLILTETGGSTGIFEGSLQLSDDITFTQDGTLQAYFGDTITATHTEAGGATSTDSATVVDTAVTFIDADGLPTTTVIEGQLARVQVFSAIENYDPNTIDFAYAYIESEAGGDYESLNLVETGPDTSIFEGSIDTDAFNIGSGYNGLLYVGQGSYAEGNDRLTVTVGYQTAVAYTIGGAVQLIDAYGADAEVYAVGETVRVRVIDKNRDQEGIVDSLNVDLSSPQSGDIEALPLTETGPNTGVFEGGISTTQGNSTGFPDGVLQLQAGGVVEVSHNFYFNGSASDSASIAASKLTLLDAPASQNGQPAEEYLESSTVYLQLIADSTYYGTVVYVDVSADLSGDFEQVQLINAGSNLYVGTLQLNTDFTPTSYNNVLSTAQGPGSPVTFDTIRASFYDGNDTVEATASTLDMRIWIVSGPGGEPVDTVPDGGLIWIRAENQTTNTVGTTELLSITVRSPDSGDSEPIGLSEISAPSGIYEGSVQLDPIGFPTADQQLQVSTGQRVIAERQQSGYYKASAQATVVDEIITFLDAEGRPSSTVQAEELARVRVVSRSSNFSTATTDVIYVDLATAFSPDEETLMLTETGDDTGIFEGSIQLVEGYLGSYNGTLETSSSTGDPERLTATFGQSSAEATVIPGSVDFIDLLGQPADDYHLEATISLRVRDLGAGSPGVVDTVFIVVDAVNDSEAFQLTETGTDTGVYEGSIQSVTTTSSPDNGELWTGAGETLVATYVRGGFTTTDTAIVDAFSIPYANTDSASTIEEVAVNIDVLANDFGIVLPLDVVAVGSASGGSVVLEADDSVTYTPAPGTLGSDSFTYIVEDFYGGQAEGTVNVTIDPANQPPVAVDDSATTDEDTAINIDVLANDSDPNSDPLEYDTLTAPSNGTAGVEADLTITYTPNADFHGVDTFTYTIRDPLGATSTATVTVTVNAVNDAPVAVNDSATTDEDTPVNVTVKTNDTDPENDPLDVTAVTQGTNGSVVLNGDDTVTYTPNANYSGADVFTYTIDDGNGGTAIGTVDVTVTSVNDAPTANADAATTDEDTATTFAVKTNDTDPENDPLDVTAVTQGANGSVVLNGDDTVTYTPNANYSGTDAFTYTVDDGNGGTAIGTVNMTITSVNDAPTANADAATTDEDTATTFAVKTNDTDPENDALDVTAVTQGTNGSVVLNADDTVTYTPNANYSGSDTFTYTIDDGNGGTAIGTVDVTVTSVNDAPTAVNDSATTDEDTATTFAVKSNDTDSENDPLDVTAVTQGTNGSVVLNGDDTVTYTPNADYNGSDAFTYTIEDGNGGTAIGTVNVTITSVNDAPTANADAATTDEDTAATFAVKTNDTDPENDPLDVTAVTQGTNGSVVLNGDDTVTYTPNANYSGTDAFTYTVDDGNGGTAIGTVDVTVTSVNDAPTANADAATTDEDTATTFAVKTNDTDPENDPLDVTAVTQGTNGSVVLNGDDTVTYTPNANYSGTDAFTYTIDDGNGGTAVGTVNMTITSVNDAPTANADAATTDEDTATTFAVKTNDTDPENDPLDVTAVTQGTNGSVVLNGDDTVTYTPNANYSGADVFTYTIDDGNGGTAIGTVNVTVTATNDGPTANADAATIDEDTPTTLNVKANDTDPDNDPLDVTAVTQGTNGTVTLNGDDTVTYTPNAEYSGSDAFTYTIDDGNGGTAIGTVSITINAVNDPPVANPDLITLDEDTVAELFNPKSNDTDAENDFLEVTAATQGAHGTVVLSLNGRVTYTPNANYYGSDVFTYTVEDGNGGSAIGTINVTVNPVNDAPTANADAATTNEDTAATFAVESNDTDVENDPLDVTAVTQGSNGAVTLNGDDTVTYTPNAEFSGSDAFTYTISDGNGGTAIGTVSITVNPVNDPPVAGDDSATVQVNKTVTIAVLVNDADIDGPSLAVSGVTQGTDGSVTNNGDGTVTYTPDNGFKGTDTFTYTVSDGAGGADTATVTVTVDAPPRVGSDLQVLYDFDEGTGSTVYDISGVGSPLDLTIQDPANVTWLTGGLSVDAATLIDSGTSAAKVITACKASEEVTLEAWVLADNGSQFGPARIVSISSKVNRIDVMLAQEGDAYESALRTSNTNWSGAATNAGTGSVGLTAIEHVVFTRDSSGNVRLYIDGVQVATDTVTGDFNNWQPDALNLVNEATANRAWLGELHLVAIYSRALSATEVEQNYLAGETAVGAPVAFDDFATVSISGAATVDVLANDKRAIDVTAVTQGANGTVTLNGSNSVTYVPNAGFSGADAFTYTVSDGAGGTDTATVTILVP